MIQPKNEPIFTQLVLDLSAAPDTLRVTNRLNELRVLTMREMVQVQSWLDPNRVTPATVALKESNGPVRSVWEQSKR